MESHKGWFLACGLLGLLSAVSRWLVAVLNLIGVAGVVDDTPQWLQWLSDPWMYSLLLLAALGAAYVGWKSRPKNSTADLTPVKVVVATHDGDHTEGNESPIVHAESGGRAAGRDYKPTVHHHAPPPQEKTAVVSFNIEKDQIFLTTVAGGWGHVFIRLRFIFRNTRSRRPAFMTVHLALEDDEDGGFRLVTVSGGEHRQEIQVQAQTPEFFAFGEWNLLLPEGLKEQLGPRHFVLIEMDALEDQQQKRIYPDWQNIQTDQILPYEFH